MPRKKKLPPISEIRQAIFDKYKIAPESAAAYHKQLCEMLPKLAKAYEVELTDDVESVGNEILEKNFVAQENFAATVRRREAALRKYRDTFQEMFGVALNRYWLGHYLGFDITGFDSDIVKSGAESMNVVMRERWGDLAVEMITELN